jgi:hypothetical protein
MFIIYHADTHTNDEKKELCLTVNVMKIKV